MASTDSKTACLIAEAPPVGRRANAVDAIEALIRGLPGEAARIRRRFWRDPTFREVCQDYRDIVEAAASFGSSDPHNRALAQEYRQLAAELLVEATAMLRGER